MRKNTRANVAVNARRQFTSWGLPCTAPAIRKVTFESECVRKSHECDAHSCVYRTRCGGCGTRHYKSRQTISIKCSVVTMHTTALPEIFVPCSGCIEPWSATGAKC